jgi:DNA-binding beta-propeller fold protein YncE
LVGQASPVRSRLAALFGAALALAAAAPVAAAPVVTSRDTDGLPFNGPRGVAIDAAHREVLVSNTGQHRIDVISFSGRPIARIPHRVQGPDGQTREGFPAGLALDRSGRLLVVDLLADYVDVLSRRGRSEMRLALPAAEGGGSPAAVAVAADGSVLVGARGDSGRVHVFSAAGVWQRAWGEAGRGPGQLTGIAGLAVLPDGQVVVACALTELALQIFSGAGAFVRGFGVHDVGAGNFSLPSGVAVTPDGRIFATDELRHCVQAFGPDGRFLGALGADGLFAGGLSYPSALATDGARLAVVERVAGRLQVLELPSASGDSVLSRGGEATQ